MRARFEILETSLAGLMVIERKPIVDERGYLERLYCDKEFMYLLSGKKICQINHTLSVKQGTIRGMHFQQPPFSETKIVSCLKGEVFDVIVDIRHGSSTYLNWHSEILTEKNNKSMFIPEGFAHGFQTLTDDCEMLYFHTQEYNREAEAGLNALDQDLSITWPLPVTERSVRDQKHSLMINNNFQGLVI